MIDFRRFELLSFDCYGTLVDWEAGIVSALRPVLAAHGLAPDDEEILFLYAAAESRLESDTYLPYAEILRRVVDELGASLGFRATGAERDALLHSLADWPLFPDTVAALRALAGRYRLTVISNIDHDLFAATARRLEVPFDAVVTAQEARAYKPSPVVFEYAEKRFGVARDRWLHVAQSLYHDVAPAGALGLTTVWVNRRAGRPGSGATPPSEARPDLEVPDLSGLISAIAL